MFEIMSSILALTVASLRADMDSEMFFTSVLALTVASVACRHGL